MTLSDFAADGDFDFLWSTPAALDGTSMVALSVSRVTRASSTLMLSPA